MQYSMLPVQRVGIAELWTLLTVERREEGVGNGFVNGGLGGKRGAGIGSGVGGRKGGMWWSR